MRKVYDGIIGLAIGDALGVPVEFRTREEIRKAPVVSMRGYGTHDQPMGTWSDDTSLTLALLDSLKSSSNIDYKDIMHRFSDWLMYGDYTASGEVFDVGNSTSRAIMNYARGITPLECGGAAAYENGNGSLMRILPIAYYLSAQTGNTMEDRMKIVHNISSLTHRHPVSLVGCGIYVNIALKMLVSDLPLDACIEQGIDEAVGYYEREMPEGINAYRRLKSMQDFLSLPEDKINSSGYVVHTLEAALWCLLKTDSYRSCVLKAVNLGEDTDTVGAVAGGLAGICYGAGEIPGEWLNALVKRQYIEDLCNEFEKVLHR